MLHYSNLSGKCNYLQQIYKIIGYLEYIDAVLYTELWHAHVIALTIIVTMFFHAGKILPF